MAAISFKSVGDLSGSLNNSRYSQPIPVGILTPVVFSNRVGGPFEMSNLVMDQMVDNFRNMLLTNFGERVPLYDFGANLRSLLTERLSQQDYDQQAIQLIKSTTDKYMPYVNLDTFDSQVMKSDQNGISKIRIMVTFSIPKIAAARKTVEIILENIG